MSLESVSRLSLVLVSVAFSAGKNGVPSVPFQVAGLGAARSAWSNSRVLGWMDPSQHLITAKKDLDDLDHDLSDLSDVWNIWLSAFKIDVQPVIIRG